MNNKVDKYIEPTNQELADLPHHVFVYKVKLDPSHASSFMYCLRLLSCYRDWAEQFATDCMASKACNIYYLAFTEKAYNSLNSTIHTLSFWS